MLVVCFTAVLLSVNTFQFAASLRINIVTSLHTQCSGDLGGTTYLTLKQLISSEITKSSTQLLLQLQPGVHILESGLDIVGIESVEIHSTQATVLCTQASNSFYHDLQFRYIQTVNISGIRFVNCVSVYMYTVTLVTISDCSFHGLSKGRAIGLELSSTNVKINSSSFIGKRHGLKLITSSASIFSCHFVDNDVGVEHAASISNMSTHSCTFVGNRRGIHLHQSSAEIFNCVFESNGNVSSDGSAIFAYRISTLVLSRSIFITNVGYNGVIYVNNPYNHRLSLATIDRCRFIDNISHGYGGVLFLDFIDDPHFPSKCIINQSVFINNTATVSGGAISAIGNLSIEDSIFSYNSAPRCGVLNVNSSQSRCIVSLKSNTFLYNYAVELTNAANNRDSEHPGGVVCFGDATVSISNGTFSHNMAAGDGGVISAERSDISINSSLFHNNTAGINGGALYTQRVLPSSFTITGSSFTHNKAGRHGGVMFSEKSEGNRINRSFFSFNRATDKGGAVFAFGGTLSIVSTKIFNNSANQGNDISLCDAATLNSTREFLSLFQKQTDSQCSYYSMSSSMFYTLPTPENRSDLNLNYILCITKPIIPEEVRNTHATIAMSTTMEFKTTSESITTTSESITTTSESITTTSAEEQTMNLLKKTLFETSVALYIFIGLVLVFMITLTIIFIVKICRCVKNSRQLQATSAMCQTRELTDLEFKDHNYYGGIESESIYDVPLRRNSNSVSRSNSIKVYPNIVYEEHNLKNN